jgi:hypothetical protein
MTTIPLPSISTLRQRLRYDPDTGLIYWRGTGKRAFKHVTDRGYCDGRFGAKMLKAHRVAWAIYYGQWPAHQIDHKNGCRTDNRITNLRDVPQSINAKNCRRNRRNKSGVAGVYWYRQTSRWAAVVRVDGKSRHLGYFKSLDAAAEARSRASKKYGFSERHGMAQ